MPSPKLKDATVRFALAALGVLVLAAPALADLREKIRIPVGRAEVVTSNDEVRTVAIAEPKIADAAVGSQRTVVVSGKSRGITTLVVYGEGGRFTVYDIEVYVPNSDKQVLLHVRVAEVTDAAKRELGWDFLTNGISGGSPLEGGIFTGKVTPVPGRPYGDYGDRDKPYGNQNSLPIGTETDGRFESRNKAGDLHFQAAWKALEDKGDIRVLATPTLLATSGDSASFLVGGELPIPIAGGGVAGGIAVTVFWKEYGIKVAFSPTVQDDGSISLKVAPEVSQLDYKNAISVSSFLIPGLTTRKTSTRVQLRPGEHLVIGGLKQTEVNKTVKRVPLLGAIPLLGFFFSSSRTERTERELLVVVSPEIQGTASSTLPKLPTDRPEK
jgi:pilus assembly protein CpaC